MYHEQEILEILEALSSTTQADPYIYSAHTQLTKLLEGYSDTLASRCEAAYAHFGTVSTFPAPLARTRLARLARTTSYPTLQPHLDEAVALLRHARDRGITFYDTADTYGEGRGESLLQKAFGKDDDVVIGTKFGYDIYSPWERKGHVERPHDWTPAFVKYALEQSLRRGGQVGLLLPVLLFPPLVHGLSSSQRTPQKELSILEISSTPYTRVDHPCVVVVECVK